MQRAVTVMGKNMLRHLGERREDEEDGKHSDEGEAPYFSAGDIVALVTATSTPQQPQMFFGKVLHLEVRFCIPYCNQRCKSSATYSACTHKFP